MLVNVSFLGNLTYSIAAVSSSIVIVLSADDVQFVCALNSFFAVSQELLQLQSSCSDQMETVAIPDVDEHGMLSEILKKQLFLAEFQVCRIDTVAYLRRDG